MSQYKEVDEQVRQIFATGATEESVKIRLKEAGYNDVDIFNIIRDVKGIYVKTQNEVPAPVPISEPEKILDPIRNAEPVRVPIQQTVPSQVSTPTQSSTPTLNSTPPNPTTTPTPSLVPDRKFTQTPKPEPKQMGMALKIVLAVLFVVALCAGIFFTY